MAAAKTVLFSTPALLLHRSFDSSQTQQWRPPITTYKPVISSIPNPSNGVFISCRLFHVAPVVTRGGRRNKLITVSVLADGISGDEIESAHRDSDTGAGIDIKLPRRSLSVTFTCNQCGERTKRLINRLAYERGLVFVQCAGCLKYHKLVDNLGLIVEYDFREEDVDSNTEQA